MKLADCLQQVRSLVARARPHFVACACLVTSVAHAEIVVDGRAIADERHGANLLSYGRTYSENRYSPLTASYITAYDAEIGSAAVAVYDPGFNRIYPDTGNGNSINADVRSPGRGNNQFVCSIVALDADAGSYIWHYQINPAALGTTTRRSRWCSPICPSVVVHARC